MTLNCYNSIYLKWKWLSFLRFSFDPLIAPYNSAEIRTSWGILTTMIAPFDEAPLSPYDYQLFHRSPMAICLRIQPLYAICMPEIRSIISRLSQSVPDDKARGTSMRAMGIYPNAHSDAPSSRKPQRGHWAVSDSANVADKAAVMTTNRLYARCY
jgi:hypothetical protein